jgi:twinkle protein
MDKGIVLAAYTPGQHRIVCPSCGGGSNGERSLAVLVEDDGASAAWMCHRASCEWTGGSNVADGARGGRGGAGDSSSLFAASSRRPKSASAGANTHVGTGMRRGGSLDGDSRVVSNPKLPSPDALERIGPGEVTSAAREWRDWLAGRGISAETAERNGLAAHRTWSPVAGREVNALAFPYFRDGELVNVKYRGEDKSFWQVKGAEKIVFGLDDIAGAREIVIVEGEMDKLALEEAGFASVVSVPDGAPGKVRDGPVPDPSEDRKFEYLWNCRAALDPVSRIVVAADSDAPGQALAEELARRLGKERCFRVQWPEGRKDANEVLQMDGVETLRGAIDNAEGFPLRGLFRFSDFEDDIGAYFGADDNAEMKGVSTGWRSIDAHYRVVPGELTVVTGVPNSGKSEWVDALMCNLAAQHGWTFALCSMENKVHEHARKLVEKYTGEPWFEGKYSKKPRMRPETMRQGLHWLDNQFVLIRHEDDELPSVDWIIGLARAAVMRHGIRGLLIDPYNELDHKRPQGQTETEYVSQMLTRIKKFAQHYDVHVWFVAHPRQLHNWRGEAPGLYDISGSAHFINKCDNGIVVHRNRDEKLGSLREVTVMVAKVRNKVAGSIGDPKLEYNLTNGRYEDIE